MPIFARHLLTLLPLLSMMLCCPLSGPGGGGGSPPPPPFGAPVPTSAPAPGVPGMGTPRAQFLASWTTLVADGFCRDGMYFRECFRVTQSECIDLSTRSAQNCISAHLASIPDPIAAGQAEGIGRTLGECAGTSYEQALAVQGKRKSDPLCNDPSHWVP